MPIIKCIAEAFDNIFLIFTENREQISLKTFLTFSAKFGIFPLISKYRLKQLFNAVHNATVKSDADVEEDERVIDYSCFCDLICIIGIDLPISEIESSIVNKVLHLIVRISRSEGLTELIEKGGSYRIIKTKYFNLLKTFKLDFPEFFKEKKTKEQNPFDLIE